MREKILDKIDILDISKIPNADKMKKIQEKVN
jgi:hypothetical protein